MNNIIQELIKIQAIKLDLVNKFTWASGIKSPIYCDNRTILSYPTTRDMVRDEFVRHIKKNYSNVDYIAGVATGAIAIGVLVAQELGLPFVYIRDKPKAHGRQNTIEGYLQKGSKVLVIEDLISTGGSSIKAINSVRESGSEVLGLVAIFTYDFEVSKQNFKSIKCKCSTLASFKELIASITIQQQYSKEDIDFMTTWYQKGI